MHLRMANGRHWSSPTTRHTRQALWSRSPLGHLTLRNTLQPRRALGRSTCDTQRACQSTGSSGSPEAAFRKACEEHGIRFEHADEGGSDDEDWDDIQEEMEDFWMRDPKALLDATDLGWQDEEPLPSTPGKGIEVGEISSQELERLYHEASERICILDVSSEGAFTARDGIGTLQIPLADLSRAAAEPLRLKQVVAVVGTSSTQAQQACIRLARVYGLQNVKLLID